MTFDISNYIFIDNHAHSLLRKHTELDEIGFRRCFTESRSMRILEKHLPSSIHYMDLLDHLERVFTQKSEGDYLRFRSTQPADEFINALWDDVSIAALVIDDGFGADRNLSIPELAQACSRPVFHCRRIEPTLEQSILETSSFDELEVSFQKRLFAKDGAKLVALKTICGYRGGLSLLRPSILEAKTDFDAIKKNCDESKTDAQKKLRIEKSPLYHYMLLNAFEWAGCERLPVQIHCGIGDDDADLLKCNPALMQDLFRAARFSGTDFVLLHCFPYEKEAAFLASLYGNVYMDLSLSVSLASPLAGTMIADALAIAPATKILAGSDGHSCPESHWYGALSWKRGLTRTLFAMVNAGSITHREAEHIAGCILHGNAIDLYGLEGLV